LKLFDPGFFNAKEFPGLYSDDFIPNPKNSEVLSFLPCCRLDEYGVGNLLGKAVIVEG